MNDKDLQNKIKEIVTAIFLQATPTELLEAEIARRKAPSAILYPAPEIILSECNLGTAVKNVLRANDIVTLQDLLKVKKKDFRQFRGCGNKTMKDLKAVCITYGVEWK